MLTFQRHPFGENLMERYKLTEQTKTYLDKKKKTHCLSDSS